MDLPQKSRTALDELRDLLESEKRISKGFSKDRLGALGSIGVDELKLLEDIARECARSKGIARELLYSRRRTPQITFTRQMAMYLAREMTELSWEQLGAWFDRHHSTVIHGWHEIEKRLAEADGFEQTMLRITKAARQSAQEVAA